MAPAGQLLDNANTAKAAFDQACIEAGFRDEWEAYRAEMRGEEWPEELVAAWEHRSRTVHTFYLLRDGPQGFLGSRGL